jgi:hypothetical protein
MLIIDTSIRGVNEQKFPFGPQAGRVTSSFGRRFANPA